MKVCTKCNESFQELALKAILVDLGCRVYPLPSECIDGDEHEFESRNEGESDGLGS